MTSSDAKPGMRLAIPVFHPAAPGQVLLRTGYELESRSIARLRDLGVRTLWIDIPELAFLSRHVSHEVVSRRADVAARVGELFDGARQSVHAQIDYASYAESIVPLIDALVEEPDAAIWVDRIARTGDAELEHASTVSFLSTLIGLKLLWYLEHQRSRIPPSRAREVVPLGVAGMLHDVGYVRMSDEARASARDRPLPENPDFREHVEQGYKLISGRVPATVAAAVLNHHQHFDGTGFPHRTTADGRTEAVSGEQIHVHARIVGVADAFDRLTTRGDEANEANGPTETNEPAEANGGDDADRPRVRVLNEMIRGELSSRFDPTVLHALLAVCPPYPPGSQLTLSTGQRCVAIGWDARHPCRPRVRPFDPDDPAAVAQAPTIDLREKPGVCVAEVDGHDVGRDNFYPESEAEFCLDARARQLHNAAESGRLRGADDMHAADETRRSA